MIKMETWTKPLQRIAAEGLDILDLENLEAAGHATCLNTKDDFQQSDKVSLAFDMGSRKER